MSYNRCLSCKKSTFTELLHIEEFPVFFGAVPAEKKDMVKCFPLTIAICEHCFLVQQINLLDENILNEVYTAQYYSCPSPVTTGMGTREIDKFLSFFSDCKTKKGKLLEIACFDGYLLKKIKEDGWDVYGCDPSPMVKSAIDNFGGGKIINDFFSRKTFPAETFDVVIFRNLLEHLYNIHDFIQNVSFCLKSGGRIFIDVPNIKSLLDVGGFGTFFHQHISYFSLSTLSDFLVQHNFTIKNFYEGSPNLFVEAIKQGRNSETDYISEVCFSLKKEKDIFFKKIQRMKNRIEDIFENPAYHNIALFGASALASTIVNFLEKKAVSKIKYILDNDQSKHDKYIHGCSIPISSPLKTKFFDVDVILISTYFFEDEIYNQLIKIGVNKNKVIKLNK